MARRIIACVTAFATIIAVAMFVTESTRENEMVTESGAPESTSLKPPSYTSSQISDANAKISAALAGAKVADKEANAVDLKLGAVYSSATESVKLIKDMGAKGAGLAAAQTTAANLKAVEATVHQAAIDAEKYTNKIIMMQKKIEALTQAGSTDEANKERFRLLNAIKQRAEEAWLNWTPPSVVQEMMKAAAAKEKADGMQLPLEQQYANVQEVSAEASRKAKEATSAAVTAIKAAQDLKAKYEKLNLEALAAKKTEELAKMNKAKEEAAKALAAAKAIAAKYVSASTRL